MILLENTINWTCAPNSLTKGPNYYSYKCLLAIYCPKNQKTIYVLKKPTLGLSITQFSQDLFFLFFFFLARKVSWVSLNSKEQCCMARINTKRSNRKRVEERRRKTPAALGQRFKPNCPLHLDDVWFSTIWCTLQSHYHKNNIMAFGSFISTKNYGNVKLLKHLH